MDAEQYVKEIEEQFRSWTEQLKNDLSFAKDGAVDPIAYFDPANRPRIVFLMKEVNAGPFEPQNLCPSLFDGGNGDSWNNVVRWTDIIQAGLARPGRPTSLGNQVTKDDRKRLLRSIAVVNLKKLPGAGTSDMATIYVHARHFSQQLIQQLELLDPDVVVAAGVDLEWDDELKGMLPAGETSALVTWGGRKRLFIKTCHPQARNGKPEESRSRIEQAVTIVTTPGFGEPEERHTVACGIFVKRYCGGRPA